MSYGLFEVPVPGNEPILGYGPGSPEKASLKAELERLRTGEIEIPLVIGGKELRSGELADCRVPHDHGCVPARYHVATRAHVLQAIEAANTARAAWAALPWESRAAVFLRAADLLATSYRDVLNASTMLGQSKTVHQAEIDAACELIDFFRFNPHYMEALMAMQPESSDGCWNRTEARPLEGFVFAVTPFNFTSIAANLPTAPAMLGNTVVWKPASTSVLSNWFVMKLLREAGLPDGVINFVPGPGRAVGPVALPHPDLAGVHFTGSTDVFRGMWKTVGENIAGYKTYPRIVGETGGKDFVFAHASADVEALAAALIRGAFEYQGQKCSAASRAYVPQGMWPEFRERFVEGVRTIRIGDVGDFRNFMGAVIDEASFTKLKGAIDEAKASSGYELLCGGGCDRERGWFVEPTAFRAHDPKARLMQEELFGPVLTLYVYPDGAFAETLALCDETSPYALTGAVFARDRAAIEQASEALRHAAGNFYVNDKPTGAVVGQQPFGGSRASGTNDKAGSVLNLLRWVSQRTIKENFLPPIDYRYSFLDEE